MQKEIDKNPILYTIIIECYADRWAFIDQVVLNKLSFENILKLASERIIHNYAKAAERMQSTTFAQRSWEEKFNHESFNLFPIVGALNVWSTDFLLAGVFYSLIIIKTCNHALLLVNQTQVEAQNVKNIKAIALKLNYYRKEYLELKNIKLCNKDVNKQRAKVERYMNYWEIKHNFLKESFFKTYLYFSYSLYTIIFGYDGGTYIRQIKFPENLIKFLLTECVKIILKEYTGSTGKKIIDKEADRLLLMEKAIKPMYQLQAIANLANVWSTYFTLSRGTVNIYIIKTDEEETPVG